MCIHEKNDIDKRLLLFGVFFCLYTNAFAGDFFSAKVVNAQTGIPVSNAVVTVDDHVVTSDEQGQFKIALTSPRAGFRAVGYRSTFIDVIDTGKAPATIALPPITPRGLYLSVYGISSSVLREPVMKLIESTALNAVVIDVKGDRGIIPYDTSIKLAQDIGANTPRLAPRLHELISCLRDKGIYTIARIVVFKDNILAQSRPKMAIKNSKGELWRDREGLAWTEPYNKEVWDYNIAVAVEAAQMGFDEIQFDYLRFPDERGPVYTIDNTQTQRVASISGFLKQAREQLLSYNVFVAADLFGYVIWNSSDTHIGQQLEAVVAHLDYISPMLYPSGFQYGIPGYQAPLEDPYATVYYTLKRASTRTGLSAQRFRPWLQAFRDYAFDKRRFTADEIHSQINAAEQFGSHGWMLWNPRNVYPPEWFKGSDYGGSALCGLGEDTYRSSHLIER